MDWMDGYEQWLRRNANRKAMRSVAIMVLQLGAVSALIGCLCFNGEDSTMKQFEIGGFSRHNRLASLEEIHAHPLPGYHPDYGMQERIREALEQTGKGEYACAINDRVIYDEIIEEIREYYKRQGHTAERVFDALEAFLDWDRMIATWRDAKYFPLTLEDGTKWWIPKGNGNSF